MSQASRSNSVSVTWKLTPIQREYFETDARYRTLAAGRRFGKNTVALADQIDFVYHPDERAYGRDDPTNVVTWWIGPTYTQTKKYGFEKAKQIIPDALIDGQPKESAPFEIPLFNGATMEFYSYDRPQSLDGAGVDHMVIDERGYMDTEIWESNLAAMLLDTDGCVSFIGKPWPNEHFQETYEKGQSDAHSEYASWRATSYDNPLIPDERIDEIFGDLPEHIFQREILAKFDVSAGSIFTRDMLTLTDLDTVADYVTPVVGIDPAVTADQQAANRQDSDYWAVCVGYVNQRHGYLYVSDVGHRRGMSLQEGVDWINGIVAQLPTEATVAVESNQAQRWLAQELQQSGIHTTEAFSTRNKEDKLLDLAVPLSNDTIQFLDYGDGLADYDDLVTQLLAFPEGTHDDLLDALWLTMDTAPIETGIEPLTGGPERPSGVAGYE